MATPLETRTYDVLADMGSITTGLAGHKYVDFGAIPTVVEERSAQHFQFDEPPPDEPGMSSGSPPPQPVQSIPVPSVASREEPDAELVPAPPQPPAPHPPGTRP